MQNRPNAAAVQVISMGNLAGAAALRPVPCPMIDAQNDELAILDYIDDDVRKGFDRPSPAFPSPIQPARYAERTLAARWTARWTFKRAPPPQDSRTISRPGYAQDRLRPRARAGLSFPGPVKQALDALIAREFAALDLLHGQMHTRHLLRRQRRSLFLARQFDQQAGNAILLLGGQLPYFGNGFFETFGHGKKIALPRRDFHQPQRGW